MPILRIVLLLRQVGAAPASLNAQQGDSRTRVLAALLLFAFELPDQFLEARLAP